MNLGSILEGLMQGQGQQRGQNPLGGNRPSQGGFGGQGGPGGLGDLQGSLSDIVAKIPGGMGGLAGGGLLSLILGSKSGRSAGGSLLKAGGLAVLSAVAFKAYEDWKKRQTPGAGSLDQIPAQVPTGSGFHPTEEKDKNGNELGIALVQAMISAAKSDGHLDSMESTRIQEQIEQLGLGATEKGFLMDVIAKPADAASIARLATTTEQASELYVASRLVIGDADTPEEKAYLDRLVSLMNLPPDLVAHLDAQVDGVRGAVAA
ncbi:tellurite resistance TerB family protein [Microvirga brassicacearum]|uniref:Tellurite resistance TerB family protein n=1 Tax=Microvirga brassicacearum TaxID=2580413 RepID=A0A5N3P7Z1_9HYPH|nr:tellurite resistance TerB family protein [Microvirga brassicacearum]KAB0265854.1 tellurite resistance TerB family protein [Microvirga brassicacearum]